jgi:hypothetical protein
MLSNLFFILIFTLILLIIIFYVIDFFSRFHPSMFGLLEIELYNFSFVVLLIQWHESQVWKVNAIMYFFFSFYFMIFSFYIFLKKDGFLVNFNFFSIGLSWFHELGHKFCKSFLNKGFFELFCLYLFFEDLFYSICLFYKMYLFWNNIYNMFDLA